MRSSGENDDPVEKIDHPDRAICSADRQERPERRPLRPQCLEHREPVHLETCDALGPDLESEIESWSLKNSLCADRLPCISRSPLSGHIYVRLLPRFLGFSS